VLCARLQAKPIECVKNPKIDATGAMSNGATAAAIAGG
jgi:hypothetical protein